MLLIAVGCDDSTEGDPATIAWKKGGEEAANSELEAAIASYTEAIRLRTNFAQAYHDRAAVYAAVGDMMSTDPAANRIISRLRERLKSDAKQTRHLLSEAIILDLSEALRLSPDLGLELKRSYQRTIQMRKNLSDVGMYGEEVANSELDDSSQSTPPPVPQSRTVFVTRTGEKYHSSSCIHLSSSKIPISIEEAVGSYSACTVCRP